MILDPAVDQPDFRGVKFILDDGNGLSFPSLSELAYSPYSKPKTAYHLPAKPHHRTTMDSFPSGVLYILRLIHAAHPCATPLRGSLQLCKSAILPICLMRIPQRYPEL